jgi:hypothetical protein
MQANEIVRVVAANLGEGDDVPMATLPSAIPYFLVRLTAICVERRELGVLREFMLRGAQTGLSELADLAGFLGVQEADARLEVDQLAEELFITCRGTPLKVSLMEKGIRAISDNGLTRAQVREVGCYVNGATRRIELSPGDLLAKKKLPADTLILPAIPARPPRIDELDVNGIKAGIASSKETIPRVIEVARLGQVLRSNTLYLPGHILFRRGIHGAPLVCANGSVNADITRHLGAHPALQSVKASLERHEQQTKRTMAQHRDELRAITLAQPSTIRAALTTFVLYCDATTANEKQAEKEFIEAADALLTKSHWLGTVEARILFARAVLLAQKSLVIVAPPQSASLFDLATLESIGTAVRRGVKVELHVFPTDTRFWVHDDFFKSNLRDVHVISMNAESNWCGFCCDELFAVVGAVKIANSSVGRYEVFFGAMITNVQRVGEFLRDIAIRPVIPVTQKKKKKTIECPP